MKQELTAVEWIEGYLKKYNHIEDSLSLRMVFKKAKEMEKKQITNSKGISLTKMFIKAFKRIFWGVKANTHNKSV